MRRRGSVFVMVLVLTVALGIIVAASASRLGAHIKTETARIDSRTAKMAAKSGLARAMLAIEDADANLIQSTDAWLDTGQAGAENFVVGDSSFRLQIIDAGSLVNINTATQEHLRKLNLTDEQIDSLMDWREGQLQPRLQGAKDEYYSQLENPYNTKLRPFDSVAELMLVKGFTAKTIFEPLENVAGNVLTQGNAADTPPISDLATVESRVGNLRVDGSARVNANTANNQQLIQAGLSQQAAQAIIQRRNTGGTFSRLGDVLSAQGLNTQSAQVVLDNLTVTNEPILYGKINLNTATEEVLRTVPELTEDQVQAILGRTGSFASLGELATIPGFSTDQLRELADAFTVGSSAFLIRIEGRTRASTSTLEAIVIIDAGQPKVLKVMEPVMPDATARWGWADETTTETVLLEKE